MIARLSACIKTTLAKEPVSSNIDRDGRSKQLTRKLGAAVAEELRQSEFGRASQK